MTANRSLDEFAVESDADEEGAPEAADLAVETTSEPPSGEDARVDATGDERDAPDAEPEAVEATASTYAWSPDGGPCATCGERVEERWREGDDLVCADCKDW